MPEKNAIVFQLRVRRNGVCILRSQLRDGTTKKNRYSNLDNAIAAVQRLSGKDHCIGVSGAFCAALSSAELRNPLRKPTIARAESTDITRRKFTVGITWLAPVVSWVGRLLTKVIRTTPGESKPAPCMPDAKTSGAFGLSATVNFESAISNPFQVKENLLNAANPQHQAVLKNASNPNRPQQGRQATMAEYLRMRDQLNPHKDTTNLCCSCEWCRSHG